MATYRCRSPARLLHRRFGQPLALHGEAGGDEPHLITYLRVLDAAADEADWREVSRIALRIDPDREPDRARLAFESHMERARWMTGNGYRHLLRGGAAR